MVIIIMGPAGAGKTTIGQRLAEVLEWPFYDGDDFHPPANVERMRAGIALGDTDRASWLSALRALIDRSVEAGDSLVLACSALTRAYRRRLLPDGGASDAVRFVYLRVDAEVLAARLATRRDHYFGPALLASQLATLEEPGDEEHASVLALDGSAPVDALVGEIREALGV